MDGKTKLQALAAAKWPGFDIVGGGPFACVCNAERTVWLFALPADANVRRLERPWSRAVYKLEVQVPPRIFEKDKWEN